MIRGFVLGVFTTMLFLSTTSISHDAIKSIAQVEKMIDAWFHVKHCEVAIVQDVNLFERKVLVKAKGVYFIMTAYGTDTFEICPIAERKSSDPK